MKYVARTIRVFTGPHTDPTHRIQRDLALGVVAALLLAGTAILAASQQTGGGLPTRPQTSQKEGLRQGTPDGRLQSGWLYVLDPNNMAYESQVLVLDTVQERVVRTFKAGQGPDIVISSDGTRLYLASTLRNRKGQFKHSVLQVIDTGTGTVLKTVENPDYPISTVREYSSRMAISDDGRWVYVLRNRNTADEVFNYLATFDTTQGRFLPETASLAHCGVGSILALPDGRRLNVVCHGTNDVRFLDLTETGAPSVNTDADNRPANPPKLSLAQGLSGVTMHSRGIVLGFSSPNRSEFAVIMGDGRFFKVDRQSRTIILADAIDSKARKIVSTTAKTASSADDWLADGWIRYQDPVVSGDGMRVYLGISRLVHMSQGVDYFDRVVVLDSRTLERLDTIKLPRLSNSVTISSDGRRLYAISPDQATITTLDTVTREIRTIYGIGTSPIRAIVAP